MPAAATAAGGSCTAANRGATAATLHLASHDVLHRLRLSRELALRRTGPAAALAHHRRLLRSGVHELLRHVGSLVEHGGGTSGVDTRGDLAAAGVRHTRALDRGTRARRVLSLEVGAALLLALGEGDVQRLGAEDLSIHLGDGLVSLLRAGEADEPKALGGIVLIVLHDCNGRDVPELGELLTEGLLAHIVVQVLNVEVGALVGTLGADLVPLGLELGLALGLLLGAGNVDGASLVLGVVQRLARGAGGLVVLKVEEAKDLGLVMVVDLDHPAGDLTVLLKESPDVLLRGILRQVLHKHVGEVLGRLLDALTLRNERTDEHNLVGRAEHAAVHLGDGLVRHVLGLVVHETVPLTLSLLVDGDLAGQNVAKVREGVVQSFMVNALVQVLDEDVAHPAAADGRITLRPHDPAWAPLNHGVVQRIEGALRVHGVVEVYVRVAE
mmetsp:Transcript_28704/g.80238  ORF Transcript_28704/g.80238 Transcript_28704/m.80238 type:complete len:440 (-) Transcript_28704:666-1985(-)